jgi:hypothetical protein
MSDTDTYFLRREANAIPFWKHHKRAQESLNFITRVLAGAAATVQGNKSIAGNNSIDTNRASRIAFVSGEPGTGKSTLYLTLRAMLDSHETGDYRLGYKGSINLEEDLKHVRWLDPLDLEVAGDEGENLLAAVLVRLLDKLTNREAISSTIHSKPCDEAIKDLEDLATDIGIAWEGNLKARAGALDPDTYSEEVMRTQRARLGVNERLKNALDNLADGGCFGCNPKTLFVLPVDDFYLKPDASLQLLRLLRMISIPRLFFLVMGDIKTIEALFIEKSLADWTAVAGTRLFAKRRERLDEALTRARELRARYLRKLLPPGQRTAIEAMDWFEALDVEAPDIFPPSASDSAKTLELLMEQVKVDEPLSGKKPGSLHTFLISPSPFLTAEKDREGVIKSGNLKRVKRKKEEKDKDELEKVELNLRKHRSAYTALQILDATPREIMDLHAALREVKRKRRLIQSDDEIEDTKDIPILLQCVAEMVNLVREEQSFLNERQQKVLESILPTRQYSPEDINFDMERLYVQLPKRKSTTIIEGRMWIRDHRAWEIRIDNKSDNHSTNGENSVEKNFKAPFDKLPPRLAAWVVLLHDLAWEWNPNSLTQNLVIHHCGTLSDSIISDEVQGWGANSDDGKTWKHFPLPKFETFRDIDRFLNIWSRGIKWLKDNERLGTADSDEIKFLWVLAGEIVLGDIYDPTHGEQSWLKAFAENDKDRFMIFYKKTGIPLTYDGRLIELKKGLKISKKYSKIVLEKVAEWRKSNGL